MVNSPGLQAGGKKTRGFPFPSPVAQWAAGEGKGQIMDFLIPRLKPGAIHKGINAMRQLIAKIVIALVVIVAATLPEITRAQTALETPEPQTRNEETPQVSQPGSYAELRTYLFIHDTSINMRKRKRIPIMQTSSGRCWIIFLPSPTRGCGRLAIAFRLMDRMPAQIRI